MWAWRGAHSYASDKPCCRKLQLLNWWRLGATFFAPDFLHLNRQSLKTFSKCALPGATYGKVMKSHKFQDMRARHMSKFSWIQGSSINTAAPGRWRGSLSKHFTKKRVSSSVECGRLGTSCSFLAFWLLGISMEMQQPTLTKKDTQPSL